eukprot:1846999-Lingulodinium_polyedra.AAC.1
MRRGCPRPPRVAGRGSNDGVLPHPSALCGLCAGRHWTHGLCTARVHWVAPHGPGVRCGEAAHP